MINFIIGLLSSVIIKRLDKLEKRIIGEIHRAIRYKRLDKKASELKELAEKASTPEERYELLKKVKDLYLSYD